MHKDEVFTKLQNSSSEVRALKFKAIDSFFVLGIRRVAIQIIQTSSNILLARLLFPDIFGIYALLSFFITIFTLFMDIGLYMSIIQDKKAPSDKELKSVFTIHVLLGIISSAVFFFAVPYLFLLFRTSIDSDSLLFFQLSSLGLIFFNLKLIPQALLEREVDYKRIAIAEVGEILVFNVCVIALAFKGLGINSFILGLIISRLFTACIFFILRPWKIGFLFDFSPLKRFLIFGAPFQISSFYSTLSGAVAPVVVGGILGVNALGLVGWAGGVAGLPRIISEIISRILIPLGARFQDNPRMLKKTIEKTTHLSTVLSFPLIALVFVLAKPITHIVFTDKWISGLSTLYIFCIYGVFAILQDILIHALWAIGYSKVVRDLNLLTVILQWVLSFIFVSKFGLIGFSIVWLMTGFNCILFYLRLREKVKISIISDLIKTLILSLLTGVVVFLVMLIFPVISILHIFGFGVFGMSFYVLIFFSFRREIYLKDIQLVKELFIKRFIKLIN